MSLMYDNAFKNFFKNPFSRWYVVKLVANITNLSEEYVDKHLTYFDTNLFKYNNMEKGREADVIVSINNAIIINIEGNNKNYDNYFEDKLRYINHLYNTYFLPNTFKASIEFIQIHINNFEDNFPKKVITFKDDKNKVVTKKIKIINYSLVQILKKYEQGKKLNKTEKLLLILKLSEDKEKLEKFIKEDKYMQELNDGQKLLKYLYEEMDKAFDWDAEYDRRKRAEFEYEKSLDIAKNMIQGNVPKKDVLKYTGIRDIDYDVLIGIR